MASNFYVYAHFRSDDGKLFYIGKGKGRRAWATKPYERNVRWVNTVAKHGLRVELLEEYALEADAFAMERYLIQSLRLAGVSLANICDGGEGASGRLATEETRAKMRGKNNPMNLPGVRDHQRAASKNAQSRPEVKEKLRVTSASSWKNSEHRLLAVGRMQEVARRPENRAKNSERMQVIHQDPDFKRRLKVSLRAAKSRPFTCVETGDVFQVRQEAEDWLKGRGFSKARQSNVTNALNGLYAKAYGFHWGYLNG